MGEPLRLGIVGCGHLLQKGLLRHLLCQDFRQLAEVAALCDPAPGRAKGVAERFGVPRHWESLDEMLAGEPLDAVFVLTPVPYHYEVTMAALKAGKHVYVQKTMALTHTQAMEMVETAESGGLTLAAAPGQMLCPAYQRMKAILADGGIGRPMWGYAGTTTGNSMETVGGNGLDSTWQYLYGGGALWNTTVYSLHALTGILGPARRVGAMAETVVPQRTRNGVPFDVTETDNTLMTIEFDAGMLGFAWGARSSTGKLLDWGAIGFYGTGGSLEATHIHMPSGWPDEVTWRGQGVEKVYRYPTGGFSAGDEWKTPLAVPPHADIEEQHVYLDAHDFASAIHENRPASASPRHGAHVVEVIEKTYLSARSGRTERIESSF